MKSVVSSWSMTRKQADALLTATRGIKNRSAWINAAITAKILEMDAFSIVDVPDMVLTLHFHNRFCIECDPQSSEFQTCPTFLILSRIKDKKSDSVLRP